jgi:hypothetical protein
MWLPLMMIVSARVGPPVPSMTRAPVMAVVVCASALEEEQGERWREEILQA